jgi:hypothetical protein
VLGIAVGMLGWEVQLSFPPTACTPSKGQMQYIIIIIIIVIAS